jgi:CheY-like chemotaxis protein
MANHPPRILIVDDYPANVLVTSLYLEDFGYLCDIATTGTEAVSMATQGHYAAILMDIELPEMNGLDATRTIRQYELRHAQPASFIIGLTAHAMVEDRLRCLASGMNEYLSKPFNPDHLRTMLEQHVRAPTLLVAA